MSIDRAACGGYWLGHRHALHRFDDGHEAMGRNWSDATIFQTAISGHRRAYVSPRREPRSWPVAIPHARSGDLAALHAIRVALRPPFTWVTPWAQVTNMLTPEASTWIGVPGVHPVGSTPLADGTVAVVAAAPLDTETQVTLDPVPVVRERVVTASVYAGGGTLTLTVDWMDAADNVLSASTVTHSVGALPERVALDGLTPPAGATGAVLTAKGAQVYANPAITWTAAVQPWAIGDGAPNVVLTDVSDAYEYAVPGQPDLIRLSSGFTVEEIQS